MSLQQGKLPYRIVQAVTAGEERTIKEWSEHFEVSEEAFRNMLRVLRRSGHRYYPVSRAPGEPGILRDVLLSERHTNFTLHRLQNMYVRPSIKSFLDFGETAVEQYRSLASAQKTMLKEMATLLTR